MTSSRSRSTRFRLAATAALAFVGLVGTIAQAGGVSAETYYVQPSKYTTKPIFKPLPPPSTTAPRDPCSDADLPVTNNESVIMRVEDAVLCLTNRERAAYGRAPLKFNFPLEAAASAHSADMVAQRYFDHIGRDGRNPAQRVWAAGYCSGCWTVAENISHGPGPETARGVVARWMNSELHRANILDARYVDLGVGVASGTPTGNVAGATFTQNFGTR